MSTLETNAIGKYSGNNVSVDDSLNLKSYTTTQRDALTSVAGDTIYNTTTTKVEFYNGSAWVEAGASSFNIDYLVIAGGGSGGTGAGTGGAGGGAGGYLNSYASENSGGATSSRDTFSAFAGQTYKVKVGGGGASVSSGDNNGNLGNNSNFDNVISYGGGGGGTISTTGLGGGSGGGGGAQSTLSKGGTGLPIQGFKGGGCTQSGTPYPTGGGGGAGAVGADGSGASGNGGVGLASSITGSSVTRAGGGGGALYNAGTAGSGGTGGGGNGGSNASPAGVAGTVNTGGGGGGAHSGNASGAGGSGTVILRWATADATIGSTRTGLTDGGVQTDGSDSYIVFTAGTGTITFS